MLGQGLDEAGKRSVDALAVAAKTSDAPGCALASQDIGWLDNGNGGIGRFGGERGKGAGHTAAED